MTLARIASLAGPPNLALSSLSCAARLAMRGSRRCCQAGALTNMGSVQPGPRRRGPVRVINVVIWAVVAAICAAGGVGELTIGNTGGAVLVFVIGAFAAWYGFRVWTFRARWLLGPWDRPR